MATATVFVDDAVQGHLPDVCARTGVPARERLSISQDLTGGLGALWVLLFFGPLGWLVLFLVAVSRRRTWLTVRVPLSHAMLGEYVRRRKQVFWAVGIVGGLIALSLASPFALSYVSDQQAIVAAAASFVLGAIAISVCSWRTSRLLVTVSLDASGRWVTLGRVHPDFAAAVTAARRPSTAPSAVRP